LTENQVLEKHGRGVVTQSKDDTICTNLILETFYLNWYKKYSLFKC